MTTFSQTDLRYYHLLILAAGLGACSSNSAGLSPSDARVDGRSDAGWTIDSAGIDGAKWQGGTGGAMGALDGGLPATGGMVGVGGNLSGRGGAGGATVPPGTGGRSIDAGGAAGAVGTGGAPSGTGGTRPDAGPALDARPDGPVADVPIDAPPSIRDVAADRTDTIAIDGDVCGALDQPCCEPRSCNSPNLICESGGSGGNGTCVACGGAGDPCCTGDVCTAPNTSCMGGGRGAGTCR